MVRPLSVAPEPAAAQPPSSFVVAVASPPSARVVVAPLLPPDEDDELDELDELDEDVVPPSVAASVPPSVAASVPPSVAAKDDDASRKAEAARHAARERFMRRCSPDRRPGATSRDRRRGRY
jgi:hypothetical protein